MIRIRAALATVVVLSWFSQGASTRAAEDPAIHTFDAKGVKLRYFTTGKGEPVVLIHGLFSSAQINWQWPGTTAALAKNHHVIALDLPGHGGSDKPDKEEAYGLQLVEDVVLLLDHLKIKKAHVVGYSLGGVIAAKFLSRHPKRVLSGTLGGMGWLREPSLLQKVWERMPLPGLGKLALTAEELQAIKAPVLILVGDKDPVKQLYVEPLRPVRKDWPVIEIEGAGHFDCIVKKTFREEIVKWVDKHPAP
jgi:pimeloyl-ACP methyl ester carboxylesterase